MTGSHQLALACSALLLSSQLPAQLLDLGFNSRQKDIELGAQYAQMIEAQMGLDHSSPAANQYVDELGFKMARASGGIVSIPMVGEKASLNVGVAVGVLMQRWTSFLQNI